jgi:hypothetical protein
MVNATLRGLPVSLSSVVALVAALPILTVAALGCSSGGMTSGGPADGAVSAEPSEAGAGAAQGGEIDTPRSGGLSLVSASTNVSAIELPTTYEWEPPRTGPTSVKFVVIVTHTAGRDAIAGGKLEDEAGATYAAFQLGSTNGTYEATLDAKAINDVRPIDTTPTDDLRQFVVRFFDNEGHTVTSKHSVGLKCGSSGTQTAKNGKCHDLTLDHDNCGAHGQVCPKLTSGLNVCKDGTCTSVPTLTIPATPNGATRCLVASKFPTIKNESMKKFTTRSGLVAFGPDSTVNCGNEGDYWYSTDDFPDDPPFPAWLKSLTFVK